jgi:hypothetical protein
MTTTTHADSIAAALRALCLRAKVSPEDGSPQAGLQVAAVLQRDGVFNATDEACPMAAWLTDASGLADNPASPLVLVGPANVFLRQKYTGTTTVIALPLAVAACMKLCLHKGVFRMPEQQSAKRKRVRRKSNGEAA